MARMEIRLLTDSDLDEYRALMLEAFETEPDAFTSTRKERESQPNTWWLARISCPNGYAQAIGAFDDNRLIGTVALDFHRKPKTKHKADLIGMYVQPNARRLNIGRQLLDAAIRLAHSRDGVAIIKLTATQGNEAAIRLYHSAGFETFGIEPMAIFSEDSGYLAKEHMWLKL